MKKIIITLTILLSMVSIASANYTETVYTCAYPWTVAHPCSHAYDQNLATYAQGIVGSNNALLCLNFSKQNKFLVNTSVSYYINPKSINTSYIPTICGSNPTIRFQTNGANTYYVECISGNCSHGTQLKVVYYTLNSAILNETYMTPYYYPYRILITSPPTESTINSQYQRIWANTTLYQGQQCVLLRTINTITEKVGSTHITGANRTNQNDTAYYRLLTNTSTLPNLYNHTHNATLTGNKSMVPGPYNGTQTLYFDGANDYLTIATDHNYSKICVNGCTMLAQFNKTDGATISSLIARWNEDNDDRFFNFYAYSDESIRFRISQDGTDPKVCQVYSPANAFQINKETYAGATYNLSHVIVYNYSHQYSKACTWTNINVSAWNQTENTYIGIKDDDALTYDHKGTITWASILSRPLPYQSFLNHNNNTRQYWSWNISTTNNTDAQVKYRVQCNSSITSNHSPYYTYHLDNIQQTTSTSYNNHITYNPSNRVQSYTLHIYNVSNDVPMPNLTINNYNVTSYTYANTGNNHSYTFQYTISEPVARSKNNSLYFSYRIGQYYYNHTINENQTIYRLILDNCTAYNTVALNYTMRNATSQAIRIGTMFGHYTALLSSGYIKEFNLTWPNKVANHKVCVWPPTASININAEILYTNTTTGTYFHNTYPINNICQDIDLYFVGGTSVITYSVYDEYGDAVQNANIRVYQYNIATTQSILVESLVTDDQGQAVGNIVLNTQYYLWEVWANGIRYYESTTPTIVTKNTKTFRVTLGSTTSMPYLATKNIDYSLTADQTTHTFTLGVYDESNLSSLTAFIVKKTNISSTPITLHTNTSTNDTTTMSYTVTGTGQYIAYYYATSTEDGYTYLVASTTLTYHDAYSLFGQEAAFMSFVFVGTMMFVGIAIGPIAGIILTIIGMITFYALGLLQVSLTGIIAVTVLLIFLGIKTRENQ